MATITTRIGKGDPLTFTEMDDNLTNLNSDKLENINNESIGDLSDVDLTPPPTNGQALLWDSTNGKFVVGDAGANLSTSSIDDLGDVDRASVAEGDVLMWDSVNSKFIASSQYGSGGSTITGNVTSIDGVRQPNTLTLDMYAGVSSGDQITFSGTDAMSVGLSEYTTYYIFADVGAGAFEISANNSTALSLMDIGTISNLTYSITTSGSTGFLLNNLGDVNITTPGDGSVLTYNSSNDEWNAQALTSGSLSSLNDVSITMPTDGMTLQYSTATSVWEATQLSVSQLNSNLDTNNFSITDSNGPVNINGFDYGSNVSGGNTGSVTGIHAMDRLTLNQTGDALGITNGQRIRFSGTDVGQFNGSSPVGMEEGVIYQIGFPFGTNQPYISLYSEYPSSPVLTAMNTSYMLMDLQYELVDVIVPAQGDLLTYNGTSFVPQTPSGGGGFDVVEISWGSWAEQSGAVNKSAPTILYDSAGIASVSNTYEFTLPAGTYITISSVEESSSPNSNLTQGVDFVSVNGDSTITDFYKGFKTDGGTNKWLIMTNKSTLTLTQSTTFYMKGWTSADFYNDTTPGNLVLLKIA